MMPYKAILASGPDALKFLQGQLTSDLNQLKPDQSIRGAHCNQKGRVEAIYDIFTDGADVILVTPEAVIDHALEKLAFYTRFSKVNLSIVDLPAGLDFQECMPRLHPETLGRYLPQELGLDQQDAVSLTKGCYLGQEVVARLHYLGKLKKQPQRITLTKTVPVGTEVEDPKFGSVEVMDINGLDALCLVKVEHSG